MSGLWVSIGDVISAVFFPAFGSVLLVSNTFDVCREIVSRVADNKGGTSFVDATGDSCQGNSLRSLTCVTF